MKTISIFNRAGVFAENKDTARDIRVNEIIPELSGRGEVVLDFEKVEAATQSFVHALISDVIRKFGSGALERISFKSCSPVVKKMIGIVVDYMQEGLGPK